MVEEEIHDGDPAVPGNDEISPGVRWCLTRTARDPSNSAAIAQFLWRGEWLISKVRVSGLDRAGDTIDLVAAPMNARRFIEDAILGEDLIDGGPATQRIVFAEHVAKIAGQQGRYAERHVCLPPGLVCDIDAPKTRTSFTQVGPVLRSF